MDAFRLLGLDESIYAHVAKEAGVNGHWMPLFWGGGAFIKKPPLFLWLMGLSVKIFGANEFGVRLPSACFGAACVAYTYAWGCRLFSSRFSAALAALLLMLQDHFILYSRVGTMDMALSAAYLGLLWHFTAAHEPEEAKAGRQMLISGLWLAAAVLIKSWFAFLLLPALIFAGPFSVSRRGLYLPPLLALALWMGLYSAEFGAAFWRHEIFENLGHRMAGGAVLSGLQGQSPWGTLQFYSALVQEGLPYLWPLAALGLARLGFDARQEGLGQSRRVLLIFGLSYAAALVFFSAPPDQLCHALGPLGCAAGSRSPAQ